MSEYMDDAAEIVARRRSFWPDPYTRAIAEAHPDGGLFSEFSMVAARAKLHTPDMIFGGADIAGVLAEKGLDTDDLAMALEIDPFLARAMVRGWHRLGLSGLAFVAEALCVPLSAFIRTENWTMRPDVMEYRRYRKIAPRYGLYMPGDDIPF